MPTNRINFVPGREPSPSYLNRVQDPPVFSGIERLDPYNSDELRGAWGINQRDGIKDYEIDARLPLGNLVYSGLVKGAEIDPDTGFRISEALGRPAVYRTPSTTVGFVNLEVAAGSIVTVRGETLSWDDVELSIPINDTSYGWVDADGVVQAGTVRPANTEIFTPLFRAVVGTDTLSEFTDLRPGLYIGFQPDNYFVFVNTPDISANYTAQIWQRVMCDTSGSSFRVFLPDDPTEGDRVAVLDFNGNASVNPIEVDPSLTPVNTINGSAALVTLNTDYIHITFVYSETHGWFIDSTSTIDTTDELGAYPLSYREVNSNYTVDSTDYRVWIDSNATLGTNIITLPITLDFGFEFYLQSIGGDTIIVSSGDSSAISYTLSENEAAYLVWVDNIDEGGDGIWKLLQGLTPGVGGGGGGSGEANTASNLGVTVGNEGVFSQKIGVDLQFKSLVAGSGISLTSDVNEITIANTSSPGTVTFVQETLVGNKQLDSGGPNNEEYQILDPNDGSRDVILTNPPVAGQVFTIVNNSDGTGGNELVIKETAAGAAILTMNSTTGIFSARFLRTNTDWIIING